MNLPPLPEPDTFTDLHEYGKGDPAYTEKRLIEYGEACAKQALEEAAIRGGAACDAGMNGAQVAEAIRSLK